MSLRKYLDIDMDRGMFGNHYLNEIEFLLLFENSCFDGSIGGFLTK